MNILLADDHHLFVEGFKAILSSFKPVANMECLHTGKNVLKKTISGDYDLVLLDLRLPEMNGFDVLKHLQQSTSLTPVIVLSASESPDDVQRAANLGARAFLSKKCSAQQISSVIDRVMLGELVFDNVNQRDGTGGYDQQHWCELHGITARQLEVLRLMRNGLSNTSIAQQLCISKATVKSHVAAIFTAFDASSRYEAVDKAQLFGLD